MFNARTSRFSFSHLLLPISTLLLVLVTFFGVQAKAQSDSAELSDAEEIRIGKLLAADFMKQEGMAPTPQSIQLDAYLQKVGDRVTAHAQRKIPYIFHFDPSPGFRSAVGLPGGQIFVGAGILAMMDTEDQLAAVLGHEAEHIALNQCRDRLVKLLKDQHLSPGDVNEMKVDPFLPGYGHDNEFAADKEGVKLAIEAGYSPEGAIRLLQMYVILGQQMTHASNEARENLEARIAQIKEIAPAGNDKKFPAEKPLDLP
jgi:predicted Zn-dependent protease